MSQNLENLSSKTRGWRKIFLFWLVTRIWLSIFAGFFSSMLPRTSLEQTMEIWPPGAPLTGWLARVVIAPWERWDVEYFLKIASQGYRANDGTLAFHPLHPLLGRFVGEIFGGNYLLGLFIVSNLCGLFFLLCLERLARIDLPHDEANRASFYFVLLPAGFIIFAPYTESLFLLCSALTLLMARRGKWLWAGVAGALAVLTRQQGIFLLAPLAWELWEWSGRERRKVLANWRSAIPLLFVPLAMLSWLFYRAFAQGDIAADLSRPQTFIYGLLISRSATEVVPGQSFVMPWKAFWLAVSHPDSANTVDLCAGITYLILMAFCWRRLLRLRQSYLIYAVIIFIISFSYSTGLPHAYMGLPRHCLLAFPLILPLAIFGKNRIVHLSLVAVGLIWLIATTLFYVCRIVWVP
jgi:hypothetical protein